jgi:hypothetical protein
VLEACLHGARRPGEHPALPVTVDDLARDAAATAAAGSDAVHLHVKDDRGADTLDAAALAAVLAAVHAAAPRLPVGVTTGAWASPDPAARVAAIRSWAGLPVLPAFASVNWHEEGADPVAAALLEVGVAVEAGLWHGQAARAWLASRHRELCSRVLLELPDGMDAAAVDIETGRLLDLVDQAPAAAVGGLPVLCTASGSAHGRRSVPPAASGCRRASAWRTSWCSPTGHPRRTTRRWSGPPRAMCLPSRPVTRPAVTDRRAARGVRPARPGGGAAPRSAD